MNADKMRNAWGMRNGRTLQAAFAGLALVEAAVLSSMNPAAG